MSADFEKSGTWAGATEQLERFRQIPVYIRVSDTIDKALDALGRKAALGWPNPTTPNELIHALNASVTSPNTSDPQLELLRNDIPVHDTATQRDHLKDETSEIGTVDEQQMSPSETLFATVRILLEQVDPPKTDQEIAVELNVSKTQAKQWLDRLVEEGQLDKLSRPTRYCSANSSGRLL